MNPSTYIKQRQIQWALRKGKRLGSQYRNHPDPAQQARGEKSFVYERDDNLYESLGGAAEQEFRAGDGDELAGKMFAVNSSSAAAVNVFHYWRRIGQVSEIARACEVPSTRISGLRFEARFPIREGFRRPPNIDVVIDYANPSGLKLTAIECKFDEPYGGWSKKGLRSVYLDHPEFWDGLPHLRELAERVSPDNAHFDHLDAPQLLKHLLGLTARFSKKEFRLLYLWYDAPGPEAVKHRGEIAEFAATASQDGIAFRSLTYQDVILSLAKNQRAGHTAYVDYLVERYL
jgi:hypothetical protein